MASVAVIAVFLLITGGLLNIFSALWGYGFENDIVPLQIVFLTLYVVLTCMRGDDCPPIFVRVVNQVFTLVYGILFSVKQDVPAFVFLGLAICMLIVQGFMEYVLIIRQENFQKNMAYHQGARNRERQIDEQRKRWYKPWTWGD